MPLPKAAKVCISFCSAFIVSVLFVSCAGQVPPSGGPPDTEPPRIISTYPAPYTLRFSDNRIAFEFNEYVRHAETEGAIFISPHVGQLEFDWSGKELEILFTEPLHENRTYVVTVGTDAVDYNNGNRMVQAFTLAFSTGDEIDRGAIVGKVYPARPADSPEGVMMFAYQLEHGTPDTLNPLTKQPDYITQTGKNGEFAFQHLALGTYRVLAVKDEFRNLLYDPEADEYGVPRTDIELTSQDTLYGDLLLRLAKEDTTGPRLIQVTAQDQRHLLAEFSEPIDTSTINEQNFSLIDTISGSAIAVGKAASVLTKPATVFLFTDEQIAKHSYQLNVERVRDLVGNTANPLAKSLAYEASEVPDTAKPQIASFSLKDSVRGVELQPTLQLSFSDFMDRESVENAITLKDSQSVRVQHSLHWLNDITVAVRPSRPLVSQMWYALTIDLPNIKNSRGLRGEGDPRVFKFETVDADALSSIEGVVVDGNEKDATGPFILTARNTATKEGKEHLLKLEKPGNFAITNLPEGQYVLSAFRDRNNNGKYDAGRPYPFSSSERFAVYPDTLKLRARWPLEGVKVELK
ncbi:MAG: Ig-like domain-containing protein [Ignavibacteriae bacterium]|nr:Ig-like domain-containing protein [Ignavibacteriota bacterium]